ncbi:hypothetical protein E4198_04110 [Streptomyces sp. RKND-216]|uniref:Uncharacterized protein n=1 Tax=Streptomyces hazeniae TaxID=3075538 RepID=A0ABU2NMU3_9ACTN|nr:MULTISPECIES: hypothetical protein [unclassified Streptomyces]MDT0378297.1 hypothetical protein [Streptomyces sp. DSM 42041]THA24027.1 hypothetical protein E4198_04110 [Streptomyces sp. RKND-216]
MTGITDDALDAATLAARLWGGEQAYPLVTGASGGPTAHGDRLATRRDARSVWWDRRGPSGPGMPRCRPWISHG